MITSRENTIPSCNTGPEKRVAYIRFSTTEKIHEQEMFPLRNSEKEVEQEFVSVPLLVGGRSGGFCSTLRLVSVVVVIVPEAVAVVVLKVCCSSSNSGIA